jgi:hypothetical protein
MKIKGQKKGLATRVVKLQRGEDDRGKLVVLSIRLTALPIGFMDKVRDEIPPPEPKVVGMLRVKGRLVRDDNGEPIMQHDDKSPEFLELDRTADRRQTTLMLVKGMEGDRDVELETKRAECKHSKEFADKVRLELADFGFSIGDFARLTTELLDLSNITTQKIQAARRSFSPQDRE